MAKLIKVDRNGSKHFEGFIPCDRCGGDGVYKWGAMISSTGSDHRPQYAGVCYKCNGEGRVFTTWIERTPEYQAKLDAKRAAKLAKVHAQVEQERAEREAALAKEREEREAAEKARKAVSQYVGSVGDKVQVECTLLYSASYEVPSFRGFGTTTMYCHAFRDGDGNKLVWKTGTPIGVDKDAAVTIRGTVKGHDEYDGERQTVLTRCKVVA